jgi:hypothetical protein
MRMTGQGMATAAIRGEIDAKYGATGKPTPTPSPAR